MHILFAVALWFARWLNQSAGRAEARCTRGNALRPSMARNAPKPVWVREEILRLKRLMSDAGCRGIEIIFNRRFAFASGLTVSKTYVAKVFLAERYQVQRRRHRMRQEPPKLWPHNARWGLDLTSLHGHDGRRHWILGIVEYASRALLLLIVLLRKTAAALARALTEAFKRFGPPRSLVTDNEGPFRSGVWRRLLARHGVHHHRIAPYSPWQNGRIERFFGTLKQKLKQRGGRDHASLQHDLTIFRHWYNRIRSHQALGVAIRNRTARLYLTPAEAWHRAGGKEHGVWFEGWNGILRGYACRI